MADKIKLLVAVLLIAAGIAGFYYFAEQALLYRVLGLLGGHCRLGICGAADPAGYGCLEFWSQRDIGSPQGSLAVSSGDSPDHAVGDGDGHHHGFDVVVV